MMPTMFAKGLSDKSGVDVQSVFSCWGGYERGRGGVNDQ